jgi:hypothetical protein
LLRLIKMGIPAAKNQILESFTDVCTVSHLDPIGKNATRLCRVSDRSSPQVGLGSHYWLNIPKDQRKAILFFLVNVIVSLSR